MKNLLIDLLKDQLTDTVMDKIAGLVGIESGTARSAISSMLPALLGMIMGRGSTNDGASQLMSLVTDNKLGGGVLDHLGDILGGGDRSSNFLSMGSTLVDTLLGDNKSSAMSELAGITKLSEPKTSGLMSALAPIAMSQIGKMISDDNMDASGLASMFNSQKSSLAGLIPAGLSMLGNFMSKTGDTVSSAASATVDAAGDVVDAAGDAVSAAGDAAASAGRAARDTVSSATDRKKGAGPWIWLLPLLLAALAAWWFFTREKPAVVKTGDKTELKEGRKNPEMKATDGQNVANAKNPAGQNNQKTIKPIAKMEFMMDKDGNVVDQYGFIIWPKSEVKKDAKGNIVGPNGQLLIPAAKLPRLTLKTAGKTSPKLSVNKDGDLVDENGKVLYKKGSFSQKDGYYVDADGKRIGLFEKIGNAIGSAAEATADAFKNVFAGVFSKKDATSTYKLTRIEFNKENHRIEKYSKPEVEALAASLSAYPNAVVDVIVHTNDGKNDKENKSLSKKRAQVVKEMLQTLGADAKRIVAKGMGSSDAAKAANGTVEIQVR